MAAPTIYQSYYTKSDPILNYMTEMLNFQSSDSILEPCGGDGVFVDKIMEITPNANISILELNPKAVSILEDKYENNRNISVKATDTLLDKDVVCRKFLYDKIIGNPPYGARNNAEKKDELNKIYSKLYTKESYTLFLYACVRCLKEGGMLSFIIPDTFLSLHRHLVIRQFILKNTKIKELTMFPSSYFPGVNFGYANLCIITLEKSSDEDANFQNSFRIRSGFNSVNELVIDECGEVKKCVQGEIYNNIDSAFFFNSSKKVNQLINDLTVNRIGNIAFCVTGFYSGCDKDYLHPINKDIKNAKKYSLVSSEETYIEELTKEEKENGIKGKCHFVPIVKGGRKKYIKPNEWFMDWSEKAVQEYRMSKKCRFQNAKFYFNKYGIAIPMISSGKLTASLINGRLFDQSIVGVFPIDKKMNKYLLAFFNSMVCTKLIRAINPSANNSANYIKKIPFINPSEEILETINRYVDKIIHKLSAGEENTSYYEDKLEILFEELYQL